MDDPTRESVIGGLYLMWSGNPHMRLGQLVDGFAAVEGFETAAVPDTAWPLRAFRFCPFCGGEEPQTCLGAGGACLEDLWE